MEKMTTNDVKLQDGTTQDETVSSQELYEGLKKLGFKDSRANLKTTLSLWVSHGLLLPALKRGHYPHENLLRLEILVKYPIISIVKDGKLSYSFLASILAVNGIWDEKIKRLTVGFLRPYLKNAESLEPENMINTWMDDKHLFKVDEDASFTQEENVRTTISSGNQKHNGNYRDLKDYLFNLQIVIPVIEAFFRDSNFPTSKDVILERIQAWDETKTLSMHFKTMEGLASKLVVEFLRSAVKNDKEYLVFLVKTSLVFGVQLKSLNKNMQAMMGTVHDLLSSSPEIMDTVLSHEGIIGEEQLGQWGNSLPEIFKEFESAFTQEFPDLMNPHGDELLAARLKMLLERDN